MVKLKMLYIFYVFTIIIYNFKHNNQEINFIFLPQLKNELLYRFKTFDCLLCYVFKK